jgi:BMFP domain-containing protein YqiC
MSFAMGWYGKELSVINQRQLELRQQIAAVQMDMEQAVNSVAESAEQTQLEFEDVTDGIQKDISQIHNTIDAVRREQNEIQNNIHRNIQEIKRDIDNTIQQNQTQINRNMDAIKREHTEIQNNTNNRFQEIKGDINTIRQNQLQTKNLAEQTAQEQIQSRKMIEDTHNGIQELKESIDALKRRIDELSKPTAKQDSPKKPKPKAAAGGKENAGANKPDVKPDWQDQYVVQLESVDSIDERFHVDWYRPHKTGSYNQKPDSIKILPKFRYKTQKYFFIQLGNSQDNHIDCIADFTKHEIGPASLDIYLDKDRNGDLTEDIVSDCQNITGIQIPFKDGTTENYSLNLYGMDIFFYQTLSGRYGIIETNVGKLPVLVMDNNGNGIFNDTEDLIIPDWNMDGTINGSSRANEYCPLYSVLKFPGALYRVAQIDEPGRSMTLKRQPETAVK